MLIQIHESHMLIDKFVRLRWSKSACGYSCHRILKLAVSQQSMSEVKIFCMLIFLDRLG